MWWKQFKRSKTDKNFEILDRKKFSSLYLNLILKWCLSGVLPSFTLCYIGHLNEQISIQIAGIFLYVSVAVLFCRRLSEICLGRIMDLFPHHVNSKNTNLHFYNSCIILLCFFPIIHISLFLFLALKEKSENKIPAVFIFSKPYVATLFCWFSFLFVPIGLMTSGALGLAVPQPSYKLNYWTSDSTVTFISKLYQDVGTTLLLGAKVKKGLDKQIFSQADAREKLLAILDDKTLNSSLLAPLLVSFVSLGGHIIVDKNSRTPSSEKDSNLLKVEIYETFSELLKKWHRKQFFLITLNPLSLINPDTAIMVSCVYVTDLLAYKIIRDEFKARLISKLRNIEEEIQTDVKAQNTKTRVTTLLNELN